VLVLGCGYVGLRLARGLNDLGAHVGGTTRSRERFAEIEAAGAEPLELDVARADQLGRITEWAPTVVFDLIRPQRVDEDDYSVDGTQRIVETLRARTLEAAIYVSSTSVYGRRAGMWTDEATPPAPASPVGHARLHAETLYLRAHEEHGLPVRIARVPGIYGPGRTLRQRLESGAYRRVDDESLWVSRIHVDDLVTGLIAAWKRGRPGATYLLCDDEPVTGTEYVRLTAELLGLPLPPAVSREDIRQETTSSAYERRISARRCSNRRMREELGVALRYPSVREGVPAALRAEGAL
jgi:nucleoside-diphosphate-sugar epimerase